MKKLIVPILLLIVFSFFSQSCSKTKTYAEMLKEEKNAVEDFISRENIRVITPQQFLADTTTDISRNEFVLFSDLGVYMQIVNRGEGKEAASGDEIIPKYTQYPLKEGYNDSISNIGLIGINDNFYYFDDEFRYSVSSYGGATGAFLEDRNKAFGYLHYYYSNTLYESKAVPLGWLVPLPYIKLGRTTSNLARVRLIVPSKQGHLYAQQYVLPYYYEITYQLSR